MEADCLMTWFKVDDGFWRSTKVRKIGSKYRLAACGLWTLAGDWSADNLTDGFVPWEVLEEWGDTDHAYGDRLIAVGLWEAAEHEDETGIQFHDWADWQPTREKVLERRKTDAARRAKWRADQKAATQQDSQRESRRDTEDDSQRESWQASQMPDPTRPDPTRPDPSLRGGYVGGDRSETDARANSTPPPPGNRPRCQQHRHLADDDPGPPCIPCRDVRLAAESAPSQHEIAIRRQAEARAARDACADCDDGGWLFGDDGTPIEPLTRCDHRSVETTP
jgi:hypothetical protein